MTISMDFNTKPSMSLSAIAEGINSATSLDDLIVPTVGGFATKSQYESALHAALVKALEISEGMDLEDIRKAKYWKEISEAMGSATDRGCVSTWAKMFSPVGLSFKAGKLDSVSTRVAVRKKKAAENNKPVWDLLGAKTTSPWDCEKESLTSTAAVDVAKATKAIASTLAKAGYENSLNESQILELMDEIRGERLATAIRDYQSSDSYESFTVKRTAAKQAAKRAG